MAVLLWCYEALLRICEIVYSYEITELELEELERAISLHLKLFREIFKIPLSPKHHFLLHYPMVIRAVGPPIFYNMMRFDSKHRVFKAYRHATKNFKAINKSLAFQHQKEMALSGFCYKDQIKCSVLKKLDSLNEILPFNQLDYFTSDILETTNILYVLITINIPKVL